MTVEDGTGLAAADTYVDPTAAFAVAYLAGHLYIADWTAASAPQRETAVIMATRTLDALYTWNGTRSNPTEQALGWPRHGFKVDGIAITGLPTPIKQATMELALALLQRNRTSDTASGSAEVKKLELGDGALVLDFGTDPLVAPTTASNMIPPFIRQILRHYGSAIGGAMTPIERR